MRKIFYIFTTLLFFSVFFTDIYALDSVVVKLDPDYVKTYGEPVYFKISVENIPPRGSLGMPDLENDPDIKDGGCGGVEVYVNYSEEYLKPLGFNWSEEFKNIKIKEYRFENGTFFLSIFFANNTQEGSIYLGTLTFSPIKKGRTTLNLSGAVSSEWGVPYSSKKRYYIDYGKRSQRIEYYPDTEFYGATVVIEGEGNYTNHSTKLEETFDESDVLDEESLKYRGNFIPRIINNITVIANQDMPKVIVKEINISEEKPNITVIVNTSEVLDYKLLIYTFLGSLLSGALFGVIMKLMRIV